MKRLCGKSVVVWLMLVLMAPSSMVGTLPATLGAEGAATATATDDATGPVLRRGLVGIGLRHLRRELIKAGELEKATVITRCLWNREVLEAVEGFVASEVAAEHPEGVPADWVDQLTILIQFLLDHADEIIALIIKIIELFAQGYTSLEVQSICQQMYGPHAAQLAVVIGHHLAV